MNDDGYERFAVYDSTTGTILRTGTCQIEIVPLQAVEPNEVAIGVPDIVRSGTHKMAVINGQLMIVPLTQEELDAKKIVINPGAFVNFVAEIEDLKTRVAALEAKVS